MKKFIKYFSLLLMALLVSACGTKEDPKVTLENALEKMKEVETLSMKADITMDMSAQGASLAMNIGFDADVDANSNVHATVSASMFGYAETMEMYALNKDGYIYSFMNDGAEGWYYTKTELPADTTEQTKVQDLSLEDFSDIKEEESDKEGYTKLVATISKDKLNEAMKKLQGMGMSTDETVTIDKDIVFNLYIKDGYITIMECDLGNMLEIPEEDGVSMDMGAKLKIELSDFNKVDNITVPDDVVNNAVPYEEMELPDLELDTETKNEPIEA